MKKALLLMLAFAGLCTISTAQDISGQLWDDLNGNGIFDGGEPGLPFVTITLTDCSGSGVDIGGGPIMTDAGGMYSFMNSNIPVSATTNYCILINMGDLDGTSNWCTTQFGMGSDATANIGGVGMVEAGPLADNTLPNTINAGFYRLQSVQGNIFEDLNDNGTDDGEPDASCTIEVCLIDVATGAPGLECGTGMQLCQTTTTGNYSFLNIVPPGDYTVRFDVTNCDPCGNGGMAFYSPVGTTDVANSANNDIEMDDMAGLGTSGTLTITSGDFLIEVDAGIWGAGELMGEVWEDTNGDGMQDAGEPAIAGITVMLQVENPTGSGTWVAAVDPMGVAIPNSVSSPYSFMNLPPGNYRAVFESTPPVMGTFHLTVPPPPMDPTSSAVDSDADQFTGVTQMFEVESCEMNVDVDAGYIRPQAIGGTLFKDADNDCNFDSPLTEGPVTVGLVDVATGAAPFDINGNVIMNITVGATGDYCFTDLTPGEYQVLFTPPAGLNFSSDCNTFDTGPIINGDQVSDADPASGLTLAFILESNNTVSNVCDASNTLIDAGFWRCMSIGGLVWSDDDQDCMFNEAPTSVIGGVEILLRASSGAAAGMNWTWQTDGNGEYTFGQNGPNNNGVCYPPGTYDVIVVATNWTGILLNNVPSTACGMDDCMEDDNNGAGVTGGPSVAAGIVLECGQECTNEDNLDYTDLTIDFGFFFQCDPGNSNPIGNADLCMDAQPFCTLNFLQNICGDLPPANTNNSEPNPLCPNGQGVPNNVTWFSFIAPSVPTIELVVDPFGCTSIGGQAPGLQYGIYDGCDFSNAIICDPGCNVGTITITLNTGDFIPGNQYWFFLDGCSGSECSYTVDVNAGANQSFDMPVPDNITCDVCDVISNTPFGNPASEYEICEGALGVNFALTEPNGFYSTFAAPDAYLWTSTPAIPTLVAMSDMNTVSVDFTVAPGIYTICMTQVATPCDMEGPVCVTVEVVALPDLVFDPIDVCLDAGGNLDLHMGVPPLDVMGVSTPWSGTIPSDPMILDMEDCYTEVLTTAVAGCEFNQSIKITDIPITSGVFQDVVCPEELENGPYTVGDEIGQTMTVTVPVTNAPFLFEMVSLSPLDYTMNGCDSNLVVTLDIIEIDGNLTQLACDQVEGVNLVWNNQGLSPIPYFDVSYTWFDVTNNLQLTPNGLTDEDQFVFATGDYSVEICGSWPFDNPAQHNNATMKECCFDFDISVQLSDPPEPLITGDAELCVPNTTGTYSIDDALFGGGIIDWTIVGAPGAMITSGVGMSTITINWGTETSGTVEVSVGGLCGSNFSTFAVMVFEEPSSSIGAAGPVCVDKVASISYDGPPLPAGALYTWNFDVGGVVQNGTGSMGPGPHDVAWNSPGMKGVTLTTQVGDCPSQETMIAVEVLEPLAAPVVSCNGGSTNTLQFCWTDVGADGYMPTIVTQDGSGTIMYTPGDLCLTVTGLSVNENVTIQVEAVDNGECDNVFSLEQICTVQNCTVPILTSNCTMINDICLTANAMSFDLSSCVDSDLAGSGEYTGNGVTGTTFDPSDASVIEGANVINYTFTTDDGCINSTTLTINVYPLPVAEFTVQSPICLTGSSMVEFTGAVVPDGGFVWDTGGANEMITGSAGMLTFPAAGNYVISLMTLDNGCESVAATMNIQVDPEVVVPDLACDPNLVSVNSAGFMWTELPGITYTVDPMMVPGNGTVMQSAGSFGVTGLNEGQMVTIRVIASDPNSVCMDQEITVECTAQSCPTTQIILGPDQVLCNDAASITLTASSNNPVVDLNTADMVTWSIDTPNGMGVDANGVVDPAITGAGVWTVTYLAAIGDCDYTNTVEVEVLGAGVVTLTPDFPICASAMPVQLMGDVTMVTLSNPQVMWGGSGVDPLTGMFDPSTANIGANQITYMVSDNGCTYMGSMNIEVEPEVNVDFDCIQSLDNVVITWPNEACADSYTIMASIGGSPVNGTLIGNSYLVDNLSEGTTVDFVVEMVSTTCECPFTTSFSCTASPCPPVTLDFEAHLMQMCLGENVAPFQIVPMISGGDGSGSEEWTINNAAFDGTFDPAGFGPGVYDIEYVYTEMGCPFDVSTSITVFEDPTVSLLNTDPTCFLNNLGTVEVDANDGDGNYTITLDGTPITENSLIDVAPGSHTVIVEDGNGCMAMETFVTAEAVEPSFEIDGQTQGVFPGSLTFTLSTSLNVPDADSLIWTLDGVEICKDLACNEIVLDSVALSNAELCAQVFYGGGCEVEHCVDVSIRQVTSVFWPNIFTPNGDGFNDAFIIGSNNIESIQNVAIFDRWGEQIISLDDLVLDGNNEVVIWDGSFNGRRVVPGVYIFMMEYTDINGEPGLIEAGDITVLEGEN